MYLASAMAGAGGLLLTQKALPADQDGPGLRAGDPVDAAGGKRVIAVAVRGPA
jgi:hypothetical protein